MANSTPAQFKVLGALHRTLYKAGVGRSMQGVPMLVLKTRGRKSGREVETVLGYFEDAESRFIIASMGGGPRNPAWYHNLVAQPQVSARLGGETKQLRAEVVSDRAERDRLYAIAVSRMKGYAGYEKKTERVIPVVRLHSVADNQHPH